MRNKVSMFILTVFVLFSIKGFAGGGGGGCTPTTSGSCATAVPLTVGAACVNGTTCGGGASDPASSCIGAGFCSGESQHESRGCRTESRSEGSTLVAGNRR